MNIINGIFASNGGGFSSFPSSAGSADTERERRIKLREQERKKRMEGVTGGDYGQVDAPQQKVPVQNLAFHANPVSKRE